MDIMSNGEPFVVGRSRAACSDAITEVVLSGLDLGRVVLVVIVGINFEVCNVISESSQVGFAAGLSSTAGVGRAHVGGEVSNNVANGHLVLDHLGLTISGGDS